MTALYYHISNSFNIVRSDRFSRGSCVTVCINNTIPCSLTSTCSYTDGTFECLSLDMLPNFSRCIRFTLVYRTTRCKSHALSSLIDYLFRSFPSNHDAKYFILETLIFHFYFYFFLPPLPLLTIPHLTLLLNYLLTFTVNLV